MHDKKEIHFASLIFILIPQIKVLVFMAEIVLWGLGGKWAIEMLLLINQHKIFTYGHREGGDLGMKYM